MKLRLDEAEARQHLLDAVIDRVSILVLELVVQLVVAPLGPLAVGCVFRLGHLLRGLLELVLQLDQRGEPRLDHLHQRFAGLEVDLLAQQADPDSRPHEQRAVIGLFQAGQKLDQRGLAGAVGPDQADPLAGANLESQLGEDGIADVLPAQSLSGDEDHLR